MFDRVGREVDVGRAGRQRLAAVWTGLLASALLALALAPRPPAREQAAEVDEGQLVLVEVISAEERLEEEVEALRRDTGLADLGGGDTGAPADSGPADTGAADTGFADTDGDPEAEPAEDTDGAVDDPADLGAEVDEGVADAAEAAGSAGAAGGSGGSGPGGGAARVAPSPTPASAAPVNPIVGLPVRRRRKPHYPPVALRMDLGVVQCDMIVHVDGDGEARHVEWERCPQVFRAHARACVYEWRWAEFPAEHARDWKRVRASVTFEP
jgi:hypothetical protein